MNGRVSAVLCSLLVAGALSAQTSGFVAEPMPTPSAHASTVVELGPGRLMTAWFGGTAEGKNDVAIWSARSENGHWLKPVEMVREPNTPCWNPVLFRTSDKVLWMYYKFGPSPREWTAGRMFSTDDGVTWSKPEHLPAGVYGPIRAKPLLLADGTIVSGTSVESYGSWAAWIERSTDNGKTWTRIGPITVPGDPAQPAKGQGLIQPAVVSAGGDKLRFFARSTLGHIYASDSADAGRTWSAAHALDLPNPSAGIDAVRLKDGRYVMIFNNTPTGRTPLSLAVSADGEKWKVFTDLEDQAGEYSYPAMIVAADGGLHITYTWKREKIKYVNVPLAKIPQP